MVFLQPKQNVIDPHAWATLNYVVTAPLTSWLIVCKGQEAMRDLSRLLYATRKWDQVVACDASLSQEARSLRLETFQNNTTPTVLILNHGFVQPGGFRLNMARQVSVAGTYPMTKMLVDRIISLFHTSYYQPEVFHLSSRGV